MTERHLKVLLLISALGGGGAERQLVLLGRELQTMGHDVTIAVFSAGGQHYASALADGLNVVVLRRRYDLGMISLALLLRREMFDAAYSFLPESNAKLAALKWVRRTTRIVWGVRASNMDLARYGRRARLAWRVALRLSRRPNAIIANSHAGAEYHIAQGYPAERVTVIPNGIDISKFHPDPEAGRSFRLENGIPLDAKVVGMLGRYDPMKGHQEFLEVAARVCRQESKVIAVVAGLERGTDFDVLRTIASELGVSDSVVLLGRTNEPWRALNAFDVLVHTSLYGEGYPNVVAEGVACGVPTVGYQTGDLVQIIGKTCTTAIGNRDGLARLARAALKSSQGQALVEGRQPLSVSQMTQRSIEVFEGRYSNCVDPGRPDSPQRFRRPVLPELSRRDRDLW